MLRSMYSGISGMKNFQTKLDVIGNNIANVNTYGFKKGRTIFKDLISQTVAGASGSNDTRGGVNPKQVGLGSQIAAIDTIHSGGSTQFTGNTLDLAISGDGLFQVKDNIDGSEVFYTRAGNFYMDEKGFLVDGEGRFVQGYTPDENGVIPEIDEDSEVGRIVIPITASSMSIGQDGTVNYIDVERDIDGEPVAGAEAKLLTAGKIQIAKFSNPGGLDKVGGNYFRATANSGVAEKGSPTSQGFGKIDSGFLEMSNVDLSEEFTEMIVAQRGFQANTRIITTSDEILQELVNLKR